MSERKQEEYRLRAHSISSNVADESICSVDPPHWDIDGLEKESEEFLAKAKKRMRQIGNTSQPGVVNWLKRWNSKRKIGKIQLKFQTLLPKLKSTQDDVVLWLQALEERKEAAVQQGQALRDHIQSLLEIYESRLDFFDELNNDCRQINFDVTRELIELKGVIAFNAVWSFIRLVFFFVFILILPFCFNRKWCICMTWSTDELCENYNQRQS